ncbi:LAQU0S08e00826g1_1 [Lachancea quebecensis]|uniref:2',3'-cyclic-nucleotide 3'-phosphodiesterase n=1 Tax=Lachancea quebecensis TaxID=1654605 RepID=A0A0N7MLR7_9SACH|nr:LAQU0S08e00826g1_1 [Lachancea quebecensis]
MGIALWFVPHSNSQVHDTIQSLILSLQTLFPDAPVFEPHLTVTSQLKCQTLDEVNHILTSCAAAVGAIKESIKGKDGAIVSFSGVSVGKGYFTKVRLTCMEHKYLMGIAQVIRELFVAEKPEEAAEWLTEEFRPHVSLVYSDVYHVNQALERVIAQRIEDALDLQLHKVRVAGDHNQCTWQFDSPMTGWGVPGVFKVVRCEGPVNEWEVLGSVEV